MGHEIRFGIFILLGRESFLFRHRFWFRKVIQFGIALFSLFDVRVAHLSMLRSACPPPPGTKMIFIKICKASDNSLLCEFSKGYRLYTKRQKRKDVTTNWAPDPIQAGHGSTKMLLKLKLITQLKTT